MDFGLERSKIFALPQIHDNLVHILTKETAKKLRKSAIYVVIVKANLEKFLVVQKPFEKLKCPAFLFWVILHSSPDMYP